MKIQQIVDFQNFKVFEDAAVDSIILILQKEENIKNKVMFIDQIEDFQSFIYNITLIDQKLFLENSDYSLSINSGSSLIKKITTKTIHLNKIVDFNQWIITGNNSEFVSHQQTENGKKLISWRDFSRYTLEWNWSYIAYDEKRLHRSRKKTIFEIDEKLLLRQTGDYPICTIDNSQYYTLDTVHNGLLVNKNYDLRYILTLLNSSLFKFLYSSKINEEGKVFAQVKIIYVNDLPIKEITLEDQQPFIEKADLMLTLNKQFHESKQAVL